MSSGPNHRRGTPRSQDNGPTFEGNPPSSGCNSTHVAKSRRKWQDRRRRGERRNGRTPGAFWGKHEILPDPHSAEWEDDNASVA